MENLGVMYLSAVVKQAGHECKIVDLPSAFDIAISWKPNLVGYSIMTGDQQKFIQLDGQIRSQMHIASLFGGPHATFFPDDFPDDPVALGESEQDIADLLKSTAKYFDINSLPWPDRTDFPNMKIRDFISSRGCPYNCLTGNTVIHTLDGNFRIIDLIGKEGVKVLTRNPITQEPLYAPAINIRKTRNMAVLIRVSFDDGSYIDCTPDHRFMVFKAKNQYIEESEWEVEAKDLKPKQSVRAVRFEIDKNRRIGVSTRRNICIKNARLVLESIIERRLISNERPHHKDRNPSNDSPDNIVLTTNKEHIPDWHPEISKRMRDNNPIHNIPSKLLSERAKKNFSGRTQSIKERLMRREMQLGENNSNWKGGHASQKQHKNSRINEINHKVVSIEKLSYREDVYCMEVPRYDWFYANKVLVHNCSYCYNDRWASMFPDVPRVRTRSVKDVIAEINSVSPEFVYFQDSCFSVSMKWLQDFSRQYRTQINIPFHCHLRPNQVNEERVQLLSDAGCMSVRIALESASPKLRKILNRGKMDLDVVRKAVRLLKTWNIKVMIQSMLAVPTSTIQDDLDNLEFNIRCHPSYAWCSIFAPYPGTALGEQCVQKGWFKGNYESISDSFFDRSVLEFSEEYKEQTYYLQKVFALCVETEVMPEVEELTKENFPKLIHRIMRKLGDRRLYGGII
jgi:radical SAM superfamily enzyme YgiQ (UPF0313 family)